MRASVFQHRDIPAEEVTAKRTPGFSMVELLVVMILIAVLAAILLPVLGGVGRKMKKTKCLTYMMDVGVAVGSYYQDHKDYPTNTGFVGQLLKESKLKETPTCPLDPTGTDSYSKLYNYYGYQQGATPAPVTDAATAGTLYGGLSDNATKYYWRPAPSTSPDSGFPGLMNPNPPPGTIVTICPNHIDTGGKYLVLRKEGNVQEVKPVPNDNLFWTLSKTAQ